MPPRGRKKNTTSAKSKTSKPGTSKSRSSTRTSNSSSSTGASNSSSMTAMTALDPLPLTLDESLLPFLDTTPFTFDCTPYTLEPSPEPIPSTSKSTPKSKTVPTSSTPSTSKDSASASTSTCRSKKSTFIPKPPPPRSVRFMRLLQGRELGMSHDYHFPETAFQLIVEDYQKVKSHKFGNRDEVFHTVYFLRPGKNALIGAWFVQMSNSFKSAVGQLHYDLSKVVAGRTGYVVTRNAVTDACQIQTNPDSFVCVMSQVNHGTGELHVATPGPPDSNEYTIYKYSHPYQRPFWCCNSNFFTERFAVGCDREVCVYSVTGIQEVRPIRDNVYTLTYNENGNTLYMGCENGDFTCYDLRIGRTTDRMKIDTQMLDDVVMLSDENYSIISGVSGCLNKIDHRMKKIVVEYKQHVRRSKRIPVSINETLGLLSSAGADDITRIWCLKTGKLLHSFYPPSTYPARSCFIPDSPRGDIHLIQDHFVHVYSMLR